MTLVVDGDGCLVGASGQVAALLPDLPAPGAILERLVEAVPLRRLDGSPLEAGAHLLERALRGEACAEALSLGTAQASVTAIAGPRFEGGRASGALLTLARPASPATALVASAAATANRQARALAMVRAVVDGVREAVVALDPEGRITFANPAARLVLGLGPELIGQRLVELACSPEEANRVASLIREALDSGRPLRVEERLRIGDAERWLSASLTPVELDGSPAGLVILARDVAARVEAEQALLESEEALRLVVASSPDAIFQQDLELRYVRVFNPIRPLTVDQILGHTDEELFPAPEAARLRALKTQVLSTGERGSLSFTYECSGGPRHCEVSCVPWRDSSGTLLGVIGYVRDDSEHYLAERALAEQRALFEVVFAQVQDGIVVIDRHGRVQLANPAALRLGGVAGPDLNELGSWSEPVGEGGAGVPPNAWPVFHALETGETMTSLEVQVVSRTDGSHTDLLGTAAPINSPEGERIGAVATFMDVTRLKETERELRRSDERLRSLYRAISAGVVRQDASGTITEANEHAHALLAVGGETLVGQDAHVLENRIVQNDGRPLPFEEHPPAVALRTGKPVGPVMMGVAGAGAEICWLHFTSAPTFDPSGKVDGVCSTFMNVTERKRAEAFREEYLSLISHDLRNPLTAAMGRAQLLRRRLSARGQAEDAAIAEKLIASTRRLDALIDDLVESARLEAGQIQLQRAPLDLGRLLSEVVDSSAPSQADHERLELSVEPGLPRALLDSRLMERALGNLVGNALKYSRAPAPVTLRARRSGQELLLAITDHGVGIPADEQPMLFRRYFRARTAGDSHGTGLGLYIARLIVEAHGGRVWVRSTVGEGSTFFAALPLGPALAEPAALTPMVAPEAPLR